MNDEPTMNIQLSVTAFMRHGVCALCSRRLPNYHTPTREHVYRESGMQVPVKRAANACVHNYTRATSGRGVAVVFVESSTPRNAEQQIRFRQDTQNFASVLFVDFNLIYLLRCISEAIAYCKHFAIHPLGPHVCLRNKTAIFATEPVWKQNWLGHEYVFDLLTVEPIFTRPACHISGVTRVLGARGLKQRSAPMCAY